jgi:hypothetical protein
MRKKKFRSAVAATADEALIPKKEGLLPLNCSHERQAQPRFHFGLHLPLEDAMGFILVVTLLVVGLGIGAALLPFVAFRSKLTRPFGRVAKAK